MEKERMRCGMTLAMAAVLVTSSFALPRSATAQRRALDPPSTLDVTHRTRLILKDGSYQIVLTYKVDGGIVRYRSAERAGAVEEIPLKLVDLPATQKWEREHSVTADGQRAPVVLSPELQKQEEDRAARTPLVAPDLHLPDEDSLLALDTYTATPELVPLTQVGGDLNKQTAHNMLRAAINPLSSAHQIIEIKGERADVQLHVPDPVLYVRVGSDDVEGGGGSGFTVDTGGTSGRATPSGGSEKSTYVIVRVDVRKGSRVVTSFRINMLGGVKRQEDVIETTSELLRGGHWLKLTPKQPLEFGEYAVMEVVNDRDVNLGVWDFGVHPNAPENADAIHPEERKPASLTKRPIGVRE